VEGSSQYLFWARVLGEYRGSGKSLDIHALEATPGILRVAEANFGWSLAVQFLLLVLIVAPAWVAYEVALLYIPGLGTGSGPQTSLGFAFFIGVILVDGVIVALSFGSRRGLGRFILTGAFRHSRNAYSLAVLQIEAMRTPRSWRLQCRAGGRDLTVVVSGRRDRILAAIQLAGQSIELPSLPRVRGKTWGGE